MSENLYVCRQCGRKSPRRQFCAPCRAERDKALKRARYWRAKAAGVRMPSPAQRGYGAEHRALRKQVAREVAAGRAVCWRCSRWIAPGTPWDLGHDVDRSVYMGPEHARCNRQTSGRRKQAAASMAPRGRGPHTVERVVMVIYDLVTDLLSRLRWAAWDVWEGARARYPACCIALFAAGTACGLNRQPLRRGRVHLAGGRTCVLCHAHRRHPGYEPWVYPDWGAYDDEDEPS